MWKVSTTRAQALQHTATDPSQPHPHAEIVHTARGRTVVESYLQLRHTLTLTRMIGICTLIDREVAKLMKDKKTPQRCGPQFHYVVLDRANRQEYYSPATAIWLANMIKVAGNG